MYVNAKGRTPDRQVVCRLRYGGSCMTPSSVSDRLGACEAGSTSARVDLMDTSQDCIRSAAAKGGEKLPIQ